MLKNKEERKVKRSMQRLIPRTLNTHMINICNS